MSGQRGNEEVGDEQLRIENEELQREVDRLKGKREEKELDKLEGEIKHLRRNPWLQPAVLFSIVAAIAATGGMLAQGYLSSIKAERTELKRDSLAKDIETKEEMVSALQSEVSALQAEGSSLAAAIAHSRIVLQDAHTRIAMLLQEMPENLAPKWADLA